MDDMDAFLDGLVTPEPLMLTHTCQTGDLECLKCAAEECPHGDPLHRHHDGCPACYDPWTA